MHCKKLPFVKTVCSKFGKMSNSLMKEWVQDCFVLTISQNDELADSNEDVLLLLDSWSGHWSKGVRENVAPKNVNLKTEKIPEGCTSEFSHSMLV